MPPIQSSSPFGGGNRSAARKTSKQLVARLPELLWVAVVVQVALLAHTAWDGAVWELECRRVLHAVERVPVPPYRFLAAHRDLNRIAAAIPLDAPVLLLDSSAVPLQYSFYLRPRPLVTLLDASREDVEFVRELRPDLAVHFEARIDRFEARDRLLTDERLDAELGRSRFLVFYPQEIPVAVAGHRLEPVVREGWASVFRIVPEAPSSVSPDGGGGE